MTTKPTRMPANAAVMLTQMRQRKVRAIASQLAKFDGFTLAAIPDDAGGVCKADDYLQQAATLLKIAER